MVAVFPVSMGALNCPEGGIGGVPLRDMLIPVRSIGGTRNEYSN